MSADTVTPVVSRSPAPAFLSKRATLLLSTGAAAVCGLSIGYVRASSIADNQLAMLLQFMAVVKLAIAACAAALVDWRFKSPLSPRLGLLYTLAVAGMAAAPGLVWFRTDILLAAALFHVGLIAALVASLRDGTWFTR